MKLMSATATNHVELDDLKIPDGGGQQAPWQNGSVAYERDFEIHRAIFDAIPASVAVIDAQGCILEFNKSWRQYAGANPMFETKVEIGENYLAACGRIRGENAEDAAAIERGLRSVLAGQVEEFTHE